MVGPFLLYEFLDRLLNGKDETGVHTDCLPQDTKGTTTGSSLCPLYYSFRFFVSRLCRAVSLWWINGSARPRRRPIQVAPVLEEREQVGHLGDGDGLLHAVGHERHAGRL